MIVEPKYTIIDVTGSHGDLIQECIYRTGTRCSHKSTPAKNISDNVIFVTYGFEYYPRVMTVRFLNTILIPYNMGYKENFDSWKHHYIGNLTINDPNEITYNDWAHHVVKSLRHVGKYYPYNGILETLLKENDMSGKTYNELPLDTILNDTETTINNLQTWTNTIWSETVKRYYLDFLEFDRKRLEPWLAEIECVKIEVKNNNLYPEIQHTKSY